MADGMHRTCELARLESLKKLHRTVDGDDVLALLDTDQIVIHL